MRRAGAVEVSRYTCEMYRYQQDIHVKVYRYQQDTPVTMYRYRQDTPVKVYRYQQRYTPAAFLACVRV